MNPPIQAIIDAWIEGQEGKAIALTSAYAQRQKKCFVCGKQLSRQAKRNYCLLHRHRDPVRKEAVKAAKNKWSHSS